MPLTKVSFSVIQVANNVTSTTVGNTTSIPSFTFDQNGVITSASNVTPSIANTQITGVITAGQLATSLNLATNNVQVASIQSATGTPAITFAANGQMTLANTPLQLTGGGITFSATQVPSADANTLDDYEEGTWAPIDSSGAGLSFSVAGTPSYTKIGNLVTVSFFLSYPANANGTGNNIGGLPFTIKTNNYAIASVFTNSGLTLNIYFDSSSSFSMRTNINGTPTNANLSGTFVSATLTYTVA
jgi:hypothetical protein